MKYRTVIELICEASDREEATNISGEYLRGNIDFGVEMRCQAVTLRAHRMKKYTASCAILLLAFSALFLKIQSATSDAKIPALASGDYQGTYTVVPALKTKHKADFKEEWDEKKDETVLKFLKD